MKFHSSVSPWIGNSFSMMEFKMALSFWSSYKIVLKIGKNENVISETFVLIFVIRTILGQSGYFLVKQ